jgi:hypothetical protein
LYRWNGPSAISGLKIINPGFGFIDGDLLVQRAASSNGTVPDAFTGRFQVDGPVGGIMRLKISDSTSISGCSLSVYTGLRILTNQTLECRVGSSLEGNYGLKWNITAVGTKGQILNVSLLQGAKAFGADPRLKVNDGENCSCLLGPWSKCVQLIRESRSIQIMPASGLGGFLGSVTKVSESGSILNAQIVNSGLGYDDDFDVQMFENNTYGPKCACRAQNVEVSWKNCISSEKFSGRVTSVTILKGGSKYFPDEQLQLVYNSTSRVMTGSVTQVTIKSIETLNCFLKVYTDFKITPSSTEGCQVGMEIRANVSGSMMLGNITSVSSDGQGRILKVSVVNRVKVNGAEPALTIEDRVNSSCRCLSGDWSKCIALVQSLNNIQIVPSNGQGGFSANVTQVDNLGRITRLSLTSTGGGYTSQFPLKAVEQFAEVTPCLCGDGSVPWSDCIHVVVASPNVKVVPLPINDVPSTSQERRVRSRITLFAS